MTREFTNSCSPTSSGDSRQAAIPDPTTTATSSSSVNGERDILGLAKELRPGYSGPTEAPPRARFGEFTETWGRRCPAIIKPWINAWTEFIPFLDYDGKFSPGQGAEGPRREQAQAVPALPPGLPDPIRALQDLYGAAWRKSSQPVGGAEAGLSAADDQHVQVGAQWKFDRTPPTRGRTVRGRSRRSSAFSAASYTPCWAHAGTSVPLCTWAIA